MFLEALQKQNPALINAAFSLFKQGKLLPDTTVIDVDQLLENAQQIKQDAHRYGIKLFAMTKQIGRNPLLAKLLVEECGFDGIVCVDFKEARLMAAHGLPIANVGHLVQPPTNMVERLVGQIRPQVITVYSLEKAQQISDAAVKYGVNQALLLKFFHRRDRLYTNQESGFPLSDLDAVVSEIEAMPNITLAGITHFPCFLYDSASGKTEPTPNLTTLVETKTALEKLGYTNLQINAPSATSCETMPLLAAHHCTHGEPGHALTGTIPANIHGEKREKVAMLYLSEISHHYGNDSYCFAGGYYRRGALENGLLPTESSYQKVSVYNDDADSIDYHLRLSGLYPVGTPVVMAYRTQVFVTRSDVALITGVSSGQPQIIAIYDALGNPVEGSPAASYERRTEVNHG